MACCYLLERTLALKTTIKCLVCIVLKGGELSVTTLDRTERPEIFMNKEGAYPFNRPAPYLAGGQDTEENSSPLPQ